MNRERWETIKAITPPEPRAGHAPERLWLVSTESGERVDVDVPREHAEPRRATRYSGSRVPLTLKAGRPARRSGIALASPTSRLGKAQRGIPRTPRAVAEIDERDEPAARFAIARGVPLAVAGIETK